MDPFPAILIVLALILFSGLFSLFDYAIGFCKRSRLEKEQGNIYKSVLKAFENPKKLSLVCRSWINILRILAAFFTVSAVMRHSKTAQTGGIAGALIIAAAVLVLGIFTTLFADALPKLISRTKPEKIAGVLIVFIKIFGIPMLPFILPAMKFASIFHLEGNNITEDELRNVLLEGEKQGIVESNERTMVEGVFYLGDRPVEAFMTHRSEIQWLDVNAGYEETRKKVIEHRDQRCYPVADGSPDEIVGAVDLEDIILDMAQASPLGLRAIMKKAQFIPQTMSALKAFESFKHSQANFLFVMDEYGGLSGVISSRMLVEEIVGELSVPVKKEEPIKKQEDGSWLADGTLNIDDAAEALSLDNLREKGDFQTLAGFVLSLAEELPQAGDSFKYQQYNFTVKEMDGNRIDKILITYA
ncbi:MAG: hemolysin family protein [Clostridiales bacterium]|jgi:putative hemolysin|nr:hemolysin family protein [Clostridiales bacterium]